MRWAAAVMVLLMPSAAMSASRVAVVDPAGGDTLLTEAVIRLWAELASDGFEVVRITQRDQLDVRADFEEPRPGPSPAATLALTRVEGKAAIDVWVIDRVSGKTLIRRVDAVASSDIVPAALAIRAVDLLRASLVETTLPGQAPVEKMPADLAALLPKRADVEWLNGASIGLGLGVLHSFAGLGPAITPVVQFTEGIHRRLALRLEIAGPAFGQGVEASAGVAAARQELATLGLVTAFCGGNIVPHASAAAGAYHLHASGDAHAPNTGKSNDAWALVGTVGAGVAIRVGANTTVLANIEGLVTMPGAAIDVGGTVVARAGRPSFMASLGPSWSF